MEEASNHLCNFALKKLRILDIITNGEAVPSAAFKIAFSNGEVSDEMILPLNWPGKGELV